MPAIKLEDAEFNFNFDEQLAKENQQPIHPSDGWMWMPPPPGVVDNIFQIKREESSYDELAYPEDNLEYLQVGGSANRGLRGSPIIPSVRQKSRDMRKLSPNMMRSRNG